jgi:hypothetical protein
VAAALTVSKSLWVHGDVPQEAKDALLGAIEALTTDAEFLEAADAELGGYKPVIGADLDEAIKTHLQTVNAEAVDWLRKDVTTRYGIELE